MLRFLKPFDAYKIHRLNVSYLALVNNSCASQREGSVFFSSCYFFFSDISVVSVLELCSHSGGISLHLLGLQELIYSKESISHFVFFVTHPCNGCCIEFVARLLSAQWKTFPQVSASEVLCNVWSSCLFSVSKPAVACLLNFYLYQVLTTSWICEISAVQVRDIEMAPWQSCLVNKGVFSYELWQFEH